MPPKGSIKEKDPKGKRSAVYFAFEVPGSWWGSQITGAARTVMNAVQCMSVDEHWRPSGALSASKIDFKVGMVMIDDPFFLRDLAEGTEYW
jgi:hypothetical protein